LTLPKMENPLADVRGKEILEPGLVVPIRRKAAPVVEYVPG
jgi:hypothetical protein